MALIGSTVDPRMFVQDYSGFQNAAAIKAAGMLNFGNQIGGAIADYGNQQKEAKAGIAKGKAALEFAKTLHPELADQITQLGQVFNDPSKSQVELSAVGNQMGEHVAALLGEQRFQKELGIKQQEVDIQKAQLIGKYSQPQDSPLGDPIAVPDGNGGTVMMQRNKMTGGLVPAQFDSDPTLLDLPQGADMWGADGGVLPAKGDIGTAIEGAARLGYKPPEGGAGQVMSGEEIAKLVDQGFEFKAEPAGSGQFRVTEVKSSTVAKPAKGEVMTKEQVGELYKSGQDYKAEPIGDGKFRVTEVRGGKDNYDKIMEGMKEAQQLYKDGKREEAAVIMNALRMQAFSMPMNPENLSLLFGEDAGPAAPESTGTRPSISDRRKQLESGK